MTREEKVEYLRSKGVKSYHEYISELEAKRKKLEDSILNIEKKAKNEDTFNTLVIKRMEVSYLNEDIDRAYESAEKFHYTMVNFDEKPLLFQLKVLFRMFILRKTGEDLYL